MNADKSLFEQVFGVIARGQTWLNFIYLFLVFPLGLIYFIFLVTGISLGVGLIIIWVGLVILALVMAGWWLLAGFERLLAISLLKVDIPPMGTAASEKATTSTQKLGAYLSNPVTWKSLVYLFAKFPLGVLSFVVQVTLSAITVTLLASPIIYRYIQPEVWITNNILWRIDTAAEAGIAFLVGLVMLFISLHVFNALAWVSGQFAKVMLGNPRLIDGTPSAVVIPAAAPEMNPSPSLSDEGQPPDAIGKPEVINPEAEPPVQPQALL